MMNGSDTMSSTSSSPPSPKPSGVTTSYYYVQSPPSSSRDFHEAESTDHKSNPTSSTAAGVTDSPSHSSATAWLIDGGGLQSSNLRSSSRQSAASRVSGPIRAGKRGVGGKKGSDDSRRWGHWHVIEEEDREGKHLFSGDKVDGCWPSCQAWLVLFGFIAVFSLFCLVIWGASLSYKPRITVTRLYVDTFHTGVGTDTTGVPTTVLTMNSSLVVRIHNPATFFGIHIGATTFNLKYFDLVVATGQMNKYYQPRKSWRKLRIEIEADKVPLYGAGIVFMGAQQKTGPSNSRRGVPLKVEFELSTTGYVVGRLVKTKHHWHVICPLSIDPNDPQTVRFTHNSCKYELN